MRGGEGKGKGLEEGKVGEEEGTRQQQPGGDAASLSHPVIVLLMTFCVWIRVDLLQRTCPYLNEDAAQQLLATVTAGAEVGTVRWGEEAAEGMVGRVVQWMCCAA